MNCQICGNKLKILTDKKLKAFALSCYKDISTGEQDTRIKSFRYCSNRKCKNHWVITPKFSSIKSTSVVALFA